MLQKQIHWFGQECTLACDGKCDKAWGVGGRPRTFFDPADADDSISLPDSELGDAPGPGETVGISEGGDMKPSATPLMDASRMNRWCARECERATIVEPGKAMVIPDLEHPRFNQPWKHRTSEVEGSTPKGDSALRIPVRGERITEERLVFTQVRAGTDQWEVAIDGDSDLVARVTERIIAKPPYRVVLIRGRRECETRDVADRDAAVALIVQWVNMESAKESS